MVLAEAACASYGSILNNHIMARSEKQTTRRLPLGRILLVAVILMPIVEISVLIKVGGWLGVGPTIALILLTAVLGIWMVRQQGFAVLLRAHQQLEQGVAPVAEVFEGFCLAIAGMLLMLPGFVTDVIGGLLLIPPVRRRLYHLLGGRLQSARPPATRPAAGGGPVIEGQFEEIGPDDPAHHGEGEPMPPPRGSWRRPR